MKNMTIRAALIASLAMLVIGCHGSAQPDKPALHARSSAAQYQGGNSATEGRLGGEIGTAVVVGDFALGVGWGNTAAVTSVTAGSNDQRGSVLITAGGSGLAQATATVVFTFHDGAWAAAPFCRVNLSANSNAVTESAVPQTQTTTTTALTWKHNVLPVDTKTYTFSWICVA